MRQTISRFAALLPTAALAGVPVPGVDLSPWGCQTVWPNNGSLATYMDRLQEAGVDTVRCDAMWWGLVESTPGQYDFDGSHYPGYSAWNVDNWVDACTSRGITPYVILGYGNGDLYANPPTDATSRQAYANYCAAAAAHCAADIDIWEIWNEPNQAFFWGATPNAADYTALVAAAAPAIRAADSTAIIVGAVTSGIDTAFLTGCFDAGLLNHVDVVSVHPYRTTAPETAGSQLSTLRSLMDSYPNGSNVAIWTGEWGYNTYYSEVDEPGQAKALTRMMIYNLGRDVELSIWFSVHAFQEIGDGVDAEWGLLDWSLNRRQSWYAMQTLNERLPEPVAHIADPYSISHAPSRANFRARVFERGDSAHRTAALWLSRWPVNAPFTPEPTDLTLTVPASADLHANDGLDGSELALDARWDIPGGTVTLFGFDMWDYVTYVDVNAEVLPAGSNVAPGTVTYAADSEFDGANAAPMACDGVISATSKWTSDAGAGPHWLALDLGQLHEVTGFALRLPAMGGELSIYNAESVEFQTGSSLGGPWTAAASATNPLQHDRIISMLGSPAQTRFVRLLVNDAGVDNCARIQEFEVYSTGAVPVEVSGFIAD